MLQRGPVRYGRIWRNLPLQVKAAVYLSAPLPLVALVAAILSLLGIRQLHYLFIPGLALEFLAAAWLIESLLGTLRNLERTIDRMEKGELIPEIPNHSWELNSLGRKVESLAEVLKEQRLAAGTAVEEIASMFEHSPVAYVETDAGGTVLSMNHAAAALLGQPIEALYGTPLSALWGGETETEDPTNADSVDRLYTRPDGTRMQLSIRRERCTGPGTRHSIVDSTQNLLASEKTAQCERDLKRKDEEVAQAVARAADAVEARRRFLSSLSDELRVPLNGIIGFAELMMDAKVGPVSTEQRECLGDMLSSARHLLRLLTDLLDLARVETNAPGGNRREAVNIEAVIQEVRFVMTVLSAQRRNVQIAVEVDSSCREATVDAARLRQVIQYFLSHAVRVSSKGGTITVRATPQGKTALRLAVELCRAARHERQADDTDLHAAGDDDDLLAAKQLVEEQGGRLGVHNTHGRSATLFAILPTAPGVEIPKEPVVHFVEGTPPEEHDEATPRAVSMVVSSIGSSDGIRTLVHQPGNPEYLHKSLESAGVVKDDGRKSVLVVGKTFGTVQDMLTAMSDVGYRPVCLRDVASILPAATREEPAAVMLDLSDSGLEEFESVEQAVRSVGLGMPVIGLLDRELTAADSAQLQHRIPGVLQREGSARQQTMPLNAIRKLTA
jgi:signal transduction histidine kinase